jgi:branched-chain amino acid transport system ATP-binding protein
MLLELNDVAIRYGRVRAVEQLNLTVDAGEIVTVLGSNGAGKSSLLRAIIGVQGVSDGTIRFDGADVTRLSTPHRVAGGLSLVPEGRRILINQTIHENLLLGATARTDGGNFEADIADIYDQFPNLKARRDLAASCLSGGEQQMLAIGRALLARPRLLMLDEPSLGLSPKVVDEIFELFTELNRKGLSILLVEQNTGKALSIAHRGYVLERGALALSGTPTELLADKRLTEAYLGQEADLTA